MTESPNLLDIDTAARHLSCTPETVRRMLRRGELRGVKLGRLWRVPLEVIRRMEARALSDETSASTQESAADNPLARALAMVQERDGATPAKTMREVSAAEEISAMRDERLAELCHER